MYLYVPTKEKKEIIIIKKEKSAKIIQSNST
jgi:hypothetical protein